MKENVRWFRLVVAAQVLFLLIWAGWHEAIRRHAPTILLETQPVDPRDFLRGDYMTLHYKISTAPAPAGVAQLSRGSELFVVLEKKGDFHQIARFSVTEPETKPGEIWVRGTVAWSPARERIGIDYGIERYFVPEGKGAPPFKTMHVRAAVSADHRLYLKELLVDGHPYP